LRGAIDGREQKAGTLNLLASSPQDSALLR
jgi:hypothetical protein